jgi:hypothetical protein
MEQPVSSIVLTRSVAAIFFVSSRFLRNKNLNIFRANPKLQGVNLDNLSEQSRCPRDGITNVVTPAHRY